MKLTNKQGHCPFCNSTNLDYDAVEFEGDMEYFPWQCRDCKRQGEEWYTMQFSGQNIITADGSVEVFEDHDYSEEELEED